MECTRNTRARRRGGCSGCYEVIMRFLTVQPVTKNGVALRFIIGWTFAQ